MDTNNSSVEVVILIKNDHLGCISALTTPHDMVIMRYDSRSPQIGINKFPLDKGSLIFNEAIKTSQQRGWEIAYCGQPLWG